MEEKQLNKIIEALSKSLTEYGGTSNFCEDDACIFINYFLDNYKEGDFLEYHTRSNKISFTFSKY